MSTWRLARFWLVAGCLALANACQDHSLNLLPDSLQTGPTGGGAELAAGAGSSSLPSGAGSGGGGQANGGSSANAGGAGSSAGGATSGSSGGSALGGGGLDSAGAAQGGAGNGGAGNGGAAGGAGTGGTGGGIPCQTDADCAPPTPGCSPLVHLCKRCSKNSQCPTGVTCSVDDGVCGN